MNKSQDVRFNSKHSDFSNSPDQLIVFINSPWVKVLKMLQEVV